MTITTSTYHSTTSIIIIISSHHLTVCKIHIKDDDGKCSKQLIKLGIMHCHIRLRASTKL